jgi:amino acid adenylation domain-containing protein
MTESSGHNRPLPPEQQAIRTKCFHPSGTFVEFPVEDVETSIPARFEKIVRLYPDRIAIKTENEVATYSQLNAMANRVARRIISERGAEPEPVGLLIDKGVEQTAAMLGVLKAGKFFVLFDPSFPLERNLAIAEHTSPRSVLVDAKNMAYGSKLTNATSSLVTVESIDSNAVSDDLKLAILPESLANIDYTSGTTGKPKGVIRNHRSRLHVVMVYSNMLSLTPNDRCSLLNSGTASAIGNSLYALLNGAALHPFNVNEIGLSRLAGWIVDEKISICAISAPLFRKLCESLTGNEKFTDLRVLRLSSDGSYKNDFELYKRFFPRSCRLANMLAPTEAGILRQFLMDHETQIDGDEIPLGHSVDDKEVFLLDEEGREVGCNEVGEIVVRSRYLSPGYWLCPELNETKFKVDPREPDQRFYYTGDLGLMLPDGCLIYKGRKDFRVKIRGYGVEIAEVEKALRDHAAIKDCIVVDQKGESGETKLIAYYTSSASWVPNASELRKFLSRSLPDYMVPAMFLKLEAIPLTPNGKVDRRALPQPGGQRPDLDTPFFAPRTDLEQVVAQIFSECTGVERLGIDDNFFELGGDSLTLTRLQSRLSVTFHREFSIKDLFEAPSVAGIACLLESPAQPAAANVEPIFSPISRDTPLPLSFSQQRLWFLDQLDPGSSTYNLFSAYRLEGHLDVFALEQSFNEILRRHEVLRTVFKSEGGNPVQVVLPRLTIKIPLFDLRSPGLAEERWTEARRVFSQEARRPFDLAAGPLLRVTLLQLADDEYVLLRAMHHIVSDGWSEGVLFYELSEIYEALSTGRPSRLADLPTQYADYANWQRQWFEGERLESQLSYWKKQLDNIETLNLPTDRPRQVMQGRRGERRYFALPDGLSAELKKFNRKHGVTLFMTLLGAFQTLLHRYSGQTDIPVGSPVAGRSRKEFDELIGFFLNMLVFRLDLSGNPTFAEAIARVRDVCLGALSHQELPFEKLVEEIHPDRNLGQNPLFQVTFAFQNTPRVSPNLTGLVVEDLEIDTGIGAFDLHLFMEEIGGRLQGYCIYDGGLFKADTIERMLGHFKTLLEGIVRNPDQRISELALLTDSEKHWLLIERNDIKTDYPKDKCIHQLFEEQVERTPEAVAVIFEDQQLTYRELNNRANQLAHYLQTLGVGPELLVGICMERSLEMVVGLLGILKAGGAYVPLDPTYPKDRLAFMLDDTNVSVILTDTVSLSSLPRASARAICLDRDWEQIAREPRNNPTNQNTADSLAYVIYTSGSTGTPKGVAVAQRAVNRLVMNTDYVQITPSEVMAQASKVSFDAATFEIWGALLNGARLVLINEGTLLSSPSLLTTISRHRITTLFLTTALFNQMVQQIPTALGKLRYLLFGGEAVDPQRVKELLHNGPPRHLLHVYGPTETTTFASWYRVQDVAADSTTVPIGRPIANTQLYILDGDLQPVPIGVAGELYIGGVGLAHGYLNRPELTAGKFIPNPFSTERGTRLYSTGDRTRCLPDGNIEFLGRFDDQVKIRGYRIELSEIETVLGQHPSVRQVVVLAREDSPEDKRLVAYVAVASSSSPSTSELRTFLQRKLPEYMVPSAFILLESLPLTVTGKLDRKGLPAPDQSRPEPEHTYTAPRTPVEELLANIWAEVLKLDKVGIHDNFFDLGGHSLLAARLISRIRDAFRIELPLRNLFEAPTVAGLVAQIELAHEKEAEIGPLPILSEPSVTEYPLSFSQERFWFLEQLEPNNSAYKIAYGFRLSGPIDVGALEHSLAEIVRRHESLRTTFHENHGSLVQRVSEHWSFSLDLIDGSRESGVDFDTHVQNLCRHEYGRPFDLSNDLLLRGTLIRLSDADHVLLIGGHHIAWDHWSVGLFLRELSVLYHAFGTTKLSPLPEPSLQYGHYARWQRKMFQGTEFDSHLTYWKKHLANAPASLNLPTDHPRKRLHNRHANRQILVLSNELSSALSSLSKKASVTLFMTFLAAFQTLLHRLTGEDDIVVGTPVAGRDRSETEGLIGLFLNSLALRTDLSGNPTFLELLARVREVALGAYDHQDLPFEKLVEELQPGRDLSTHPIFQVFINMYNFEEVCLDLARLSVERVNLKWTGAQFDLSFFIREYSDGLQLTFQYDDDLFEFSTVTRMLGNFHTLLQSIVSHPEQRISDLGSLTDCEKHRLLVEWNDTKSDYPNDNCIHQLFEEQVERTPEAVAVVFEDQQLTYRELNARANQLAHHLQTLGVGPDVLVGICLDRSIEMVVGLLGILKAGGAYLPLDPTYPEDRVAFMFAEAQPKVLLSQACLLDKLPASSGEVLCLDSEWDVIGRESIDNPSNESAPSDLAYIIYTSGSTGRPKGAMVSHRAIVNHMHWMQGTFRFTETDAIVQKTPISFDASVWEIFAPLLAGSRLIVAKPDGHRNCAYLSRLIQKQGATVLQLVPSMLREMLQDRDFAACTTLRLVFCGGEALPADLPQKFYACFESRATLWNLYGPTEASIDATYWECKRDSEEAMIPIGRPIANAQIYILDRQLQPVPIGVAGELHIGGDGVARGYLNQPELTAEKFIYHSFNGEPARRVYRTGDLARYLPDGNIEFLGRIDNQVKLRGYRIELGEIEAVLGQHPLVQSSVVVVREDTPGDKRLVGYVVGREKSFDGAEIRKYLKQKLPEYMVPSAFVRLDELPLTPNGKVDRKALPAPDQDRPELGNIYQAPRTPVEEALASIWCELLKVDKVGIQDNFFELGGHSLLATQIMSRVRSGLSIELPLRTLFESPTVEQLAEAIMEQRAEESGEQELERVLLELEPDKEGATSLALRADIDERLRTT